MRKRHPLADSASEQVSEIKSERVAGFKSESMAGSIGIRSFDVVTFRMAISEGWLPGLRRLVTYSFDYGLAEGRFVLGPCNLALEGRHLATELPVDQAVEVTQTISVARERATESQRGKTVELAAAAAAAVKYGESSSDKTAAKANDGRQLSDKRRANQVAVYAGGTSAAPAWHFVTAALSERFSDGQRAVLAGRWKGEMAEFKIVNRGRNVTVSGRFHARPQDVVVTRVCDEACFAELKPEKRIGIQAAFVKCVRDHPAILNRG